ncbi:hypothetical protein BCR36DRAFT_358753, partial [Piromyces finnis]
MGGNSLAINESTILFPNYENSKDIDGISLNEGNNYIENSNISSIFNNNLNYLLYFNGNNKYSLSIKSSIFNGENTSSGVKAEFGIINIESSNFINLYSPYNGGALYISQSKVLLNNLYFENNKAENCGGSIYLMNNLNVEGNNLKGHNIYAGYTGSLLDISSQNIDNIHNFNNITLINDWNARNSNGYGLILCAKSNSYVILKNAYGSDLYCEDSACNIFLATGNTILNIENTNINNVYGVIGSIFLESFMENNSNSNEIVKVKISNCSLSNIYQNTLSKSSILSYIKSGEIVINDCILNNIYGTRSYIVYSISKGQLEMNNIEINNFHNNIESGGFYTIEDFPMTINNLKIYNSTFYGFIFASDKAYFGVNNSIIKNINTEIIEKLLDDGTYTVKDKYINENYLIARTNLDNAELVFQNVTFDNIYGEKGFTLLNKSKIVIKKSNFSNNFFTNAFFHISKENEAPIGSVEITSSTFYNNGGYTNGSILNFNAKGYFYGLYKFNSCIFNNNYSYGNGGVIYSINEHASELILFVNCEFNNNKAKNGSICYALSKKTEPYVSDKLLYIGNKGIAFATNPSIMKLINSPYNGLTILSGNTISKYGKLKLLDDYSNNISFDLDLTNNNLKINDLMFYKISFNDTYNVHISSAIYGYYSGYNNYLPNIKIIGNPGNYLLSISMISFGPFFSFDNNIVSLPISIKECPKNYSNNYLEENNFKTCYLPKCSPSCNSGTCIKDNVCDCSTSILKGKYCNEHKEYKRPQHLKYLINILSAISILLSIISMVVIVENRKDKIIQAASYDFLLIILFGTIIINCHTILSKYKNTLKWCYISKLMNNIGFSLIYFSIFIKLLRVLKIFFSSKIYSISLKK